MARLVDINVAKILRNATNVRETDDELGLDELAKRIESQGLPQPIIVCPKGDKYELIAGLQRLIAMEKLGKETVPAMVIDPTETNMVRLLSLLENIQVLMK